MNGVGHVLSGVGEPMTDDEPYGFNLSPDFAPWWKQIPGAYGEETRTRRTPERGEAFVAKDNIHPSWPVTKGNDERNLRSSFTGKPIKQLPHRNYPGSFPHGWVDYNDLYAATGPERGPRPSGWESAPRYADEKARAIEAAMPSPWASEENMVYDISGFGDLASAMGHHGFGHLGLYVPPSVSTAIASQATTAALEAATPSLAMQISSAVVDFGSSSAALYLQQREMERQRAAERTRLALEAQRLELLRKQAAAAGVPFRPTSGVGLGTVALAGGGVVAIAALVYALTRGKRKGGRR